MDDLDKLIALLVKQGKYVNTAHFMIQHPQATFPSRYRWWRAGKNANGRRVCMCFLDAAWCGHWLAWQETVLLKNKRSRTRLAVAACHKDAYDLSGKRARAYVAKCGGVFTPLQEEW